MEKMALPGIKVERDAKGRTSKIIINAKSNTELVENLLDIIAAEEAKAADDPDRQGFVTWDSLKAELIKEGKLKKK